MLESDASGFGKFASRIHHHNNFLKFLRAQNYEFVLVRVGGSNFKYWISFRSRWDKGSSVLHWFWLIVQQVPAVGKKIFTLHL